MVRIWRRVAIWLVVLVLPLQGLAANAAMRCLMMPGKAMPTVAAVAELPPCHAQMLADGQDLPADAAPDPASPPCPHCMACMTLAAGAWPLTNAQPAVPRPAQAAPAGAEPQHHAIAFLTDGPDRPPRTAQR